MKVPISVWLSAVVLLLFSLNFAINNPAEFFKALVFTTIAAAFLRVIYWFIEGE